MTRGEQKLFSAITIVEAIALTMQQIYENFYFQNYKAIKNFIWQIWIE